MAYTEVVRKNLDWFRNSGILVDNGSNGIHERIWLLDNDHPLVDGNRLHRESVFRYRRVDCALETALLFDTAESLFPGEGNEQVARNLVHFVQEVPFQETRKEHPEFGLHAHGLTFDYALPVKMFLDKNPTLRKHKDDLSFWDKKWVDDNSWAVIIPLALGDRIGVDTQRALITAEALLDKKDILRGYCRGKMDGVPHWGGMRNMALAYVFGLTQDKRFETETLASMEIDFEKIRKFEKGEISQPYDVSNAAYFVMQASTIFASLRQTSDVEKALDIVVDYLISRQHTDGHWPGEWWEGSSGEHIADLVYGQNFATLGMQAYNYLKPSPETADSVKRSLEFLTQIQHKSSFPKTNGAWLGAYDTERKKWGGEDRKEGGPSCVYSGWTNAPIALAFALEYQFTLLPHSPHPFFPARGEESLIQTADKARELYEEHKSQSSSN